MDGILLVDKTKGPTSHDVVAKLRRLLRTRAVGHAGTLDPMATGLLVLGVGEGTKLLAALTDDDKAYEATIRFGVATDTLDAEGKETGRADVPPLDVGVVSSAAARFVGSYAQRAPIFSAIKRDGETLHARARRGEEVEAPVREVLLRRVDVLGVTGETATLRLDCGKGFYVRSFARDLAEALGTLGHLVALRRIRSGGHDVADAVPFARLLEEGGDALARDAVRPMADSLGTIPRFTLTPNGLLDAAFGRPIDLADAGVAATDLPPRVALVTENGKLAALATLENERLVIVRGFVEGQSQAVRPPRRTEVVP